MNKKNEGWGISLQGWICCYGFVNHLIDVSLCALWLAWGGLPMLVEGKYLGC